MSILSNIINPTICEITQAILSTNDGSVYDLKPLIARFSMEQSIESSTLSGTISIVDKVGFLESVPLRGEETLAINLYGNDFKTQKLLYLHIYKIDNIIFSDNNDGSSYTLHYISSMSFKASTKRITAPYQGIISNMVTDVFSTYFSNLTPKSANTVFGTQYYGTNIDEKGLYVQPTVGNYTFVIPFYEPHETMYFLASRSYSSDSPSCSFRFFEDTDNYNFVTDEFLIKNSITNKNVKNFTYKAVTSKDPSNISQQLTNLQNISNQRHVDTAADLYSGAYTNNVIEVDLLRKKVTNNYFNFLKDGNYISMDGTTQKTNNNLHTTNFINQTFTNDNGKHYLIFRDYSSVGDTPGELRDEQFLNKITANRTSYLHHLNNTVLLGQITGRLDIKAGEIVDISIGEFSAQTKRGLNKQLSGYYLIHSVNHSIVHDILTTTMKFVKYDWSGNV